MLAPSAAAGAMSTRNEASSPLPAAPHTPLAPWLAGAGEPLGCLFLTRISTKSTTSTCLPQHSVTLREARRLHPMPPPPPHPLPSRAHPLLSMSAALNICSSWVLQAGRGETK